MDIESEEEKAMRAEERQRKNRESAARYARVEDVGCRLQGVG